MSKDKPIVIEMDKIRLDVSVSKAELKIYGKKGLKSIFIDLVERYFTPEYYDQDLVQDILQEKEDDK